MAVQSRVAAARLPVARGKMGNVSKPPVGRDGGVLGASDQNRPHADRAGALDVEHGIVADEEDSSCRDIEVVARLLKQHRRRFHVRAVR